MYKLYQLNNQLTVLLMPRLTTSDVAITIGGRLGSRHETKKNNGYLHLMEHAILEGSRRFPDALITQILLDYMAGDINADIGKDAIFFHLIMTADQVKRGFDLISDSLLHPLLLPACINKEKGAVIEELKADLDDLSDLADVLCDQLVFGDNPLGLPTIGQEKIVKETCGSQIERAWKRLINPKRLVLSIVGRFDIDTMKAKINEQFSPLKLREYPPPIQITHRQTKPNLGIIKKSSEQIAFQLCLPFYPEDKIDLFTLSLLNNIYGGRFGSRIYQELRGRRGLVYSIGSHIWNYGDVGIMVVHSSCQAKSLPSVLTCILNEMRRLKAEKVTVDRTTIDQDLTVDPLQVSKRYQCGWASRDFRKDLHAAKFYAGQLLRYGKIVPLQSYKTGINRVTAAQIQQAAQTIFDGNRLNLALVGPVDNTLQQEIEKMLIL